MDDNISDDVNILSALSSDEGELFDNDSDQENADISVVIDSDDDHEVIDVEANVITGGGRGSPESDEVVVVENNVIDLLNDSDTVESIEDEDGQGQDEEDDEVVVEGDEEERNSQPSPVNSGHLRLPLSPPAGLERVQPPLTPGPRTQHYHLISSDSSSPPHHPSTSSQHHHSPHQSSSPPHPSTSAYQPSPRHSTSGVNPSTPPPSSSPTEANRRSPPPSTSSMPSPSAPGPSVASHPHHNSSMDDFQTPVLHRASSVAGATVVGARPSDSSVEFQPRKRRRVVSASPRAKSSVSSGQGDAATNGDDNNDDDDDGNYCSICFEPWDNSGRHRLASLKCGHLYGLGCIEKWLKGQGGKCPSCNVKAKLKDIRVIYAKAVKVVDTTERDRALEDLSRERERRRQAELEAAEARLHSQQTAQEAECLRTQLDSLKTQLATFRSSGGGEGVRPSQSGCQAVSSSQQSQGQFSHHKTVRISESGQCRVMAYCPSLAVLVISQPSSSNLFPGFGIKKLSCMDLKTSSFLPLHQKAIRGLSFHQSLDDGLLLSVSMDRAIKLTSVITSTNVQKYTASMPVWSCEWNADSQHYFYVGQQNGLVLEFDTRNTGGPVRELNQEGSRSPVVALQYIARDSHADFRPGGLLVGQLDRVSFFESRGEESRLHILPLEGNLTSLKVEPRTRHVLASFRPSAKHPSVRHQLCALRSGGGGGVGVDGVGQAVSCHVVDTFYGGRSQSVLGRTHLIPHPAHDARLMVVAGDEPSESAYVWDAGTSRLVQKLPCQGVPVDFASFTSNNQPHLAALTDKCLKVHTWQL